MNMIFSVDKNWGLGHRGKLLFSIRQDMKFFKDKTLGNVVVMGRKTLDSLPGGKPLKDRVNIVLTHDENFNREGVIVCHSKDELLKKLEEYPTDKVFIIGGEQIYKMMMQHCNRAYVTKVDAEKTADTHMYNLDKDVHWKHAESSKDFSDKDLVYRFSIYERIKEFIDN